MASHQLQWDRDCLGTQQWQLSWVGGGGGEEGEALPLSLFIAYHGMDGCKGIVNSGLAPPPAHRSPFYMEQKQTSTPSGVSNIRLHLWGIRLSFLQAWGPA